MLTVVDPNRRGSGARAASARRLAREGQGPLSADKHCSAGRSQGAAGFTLVELMVVIGILLIMLSMSIPIYRNAIIHQKEVQLQQDLRTMRQLIDEYTLDKMKAPQALDDLVSAGYMRQLPVDPFTESSSTWQVEMQEELRFAQQTDGGVVDVHSGSERVSSDGSPYSSW